MTRSPDGPKVTGGVSVKIEGLKEILHGLPGRRILVVGDVMLDEYIWGEVRRISPEAPVPVVEVRRRSFMAGGVANTAVNIAALGGQSLLAGVTGDDTHAGTLTNLLTDFGVPTDGLIADPGRPTTTKSRIIAHNQQVVRVDCEHRDPIPSSVEDRLLSWIEDQVPRVGAVVLSDYDKGVSSPRLTQALIRAGRASNRPVIIDPKGSHLAKYRGASVVKPNLREAELLAQRPITGEAELRDAARSILRSLDGSALLITRGSEGMSLFRQHADSIHIPAMTREVYDVTGAGDTVTATVAMALASGATLEQAAYLANIAAGIAVGQIGATAVTLRQLTHELGEPALPKPRGDR
jgi:D-beta-D-heptose 7-phosphate kinase/D-beta-D-heptose 1-phosphate adenosyltransferase